MTLDTFRGLLAEKSDLLVGTDLADDGVPTRFKICSLLQVTAIKPLGGATQRTAR